MKTVSFYSIKGGVGKSSVAVNIAYLASLRGVRTLLLDIDAQGASSFYLNVDPVAGTNVKSLAEGKKSVRDQIRASDFPGLDVIPARVGLRNLDLVLDKKETGLKPLAARLAKEYDLLLIDCPPQIGMTGEAIFELSDTLLVPTIPSPLSVRTLEQLIKFFTRKKLNPGKIRPFICMFDGRKKMHVQTTLDVKSQFPSCLEAVIPFAVEFEKMGIQKKPLSNYAPRGKAAFALEALFQELRQEDLL